MRTFFLLCCAVIVILAIAAVAWCESRNPMAERQGPYYSFTKIEAKPEYRICAVPFAILAIYVVLDTLRRLPK